MCPIEGKTSKPWGAYIRAAHIRVHQDKGIPAYSSYPSARFKFCNVVHRLSTHGILVQFTTHLQALRSSTLEQIIQPGDRNDPFPT